MQSGKTYLQITSTAQKIKDSVIVRISETDANSWCVGGAIIIWPSRTVPADRTTSGGEEFPPGVPTALARAEESREQYGFKRVTICLEHGCTWNPQWGTLHAVESFDTELEASLSQANGTTAPA